MDLSRDVFPQSDLPGASKNWGRTVESHLRATERETKNLARTTNNALRSLGGQLDTQAALVDELLLGRITTSTELDEIKVTATTPGVFPTVTTPFSLQPPRGGDRAGTFTVSGDIVNTSGPSSTSSITLWFELLRDGVAIWRKPNSIIVGVAPSAPDSWGDAGFSDTFSLVVPEGASNYSLRIYTHTFVAGTVSASVLNFTATLVYGDRV